MAATNVSTPTSRGFADEIAMHALAMLPGPYLPWSAGTTRPAGLVTVCNDIVLNDRRRIVELGSGISTVLLARLLTQRALPASLKIRHESETAAVTHALRQAAAPLKEYRTL
jgi:hypothetical protein